MLCDSKDSKKGFIPPFFLLFVLTGLRVYRHFDKGSFKDKDKGSFLNLLEKEDLLEKDDSKRKRKRKRNNRNNRKDPSMDLLQLGERLAAYKVSDKIANEVFFSLLKSQSPGSPPRRSFGVTPLIFLLFRLSMN